jgi:hypothetical protein
VAKVANKQEFYDLTAKGRLGNQMGCWHSISDMKRSGSRGPFMLRYAGITGCGNFRPGIPYEQIEKAFATWVRKGAEESRIRIWESPPIQRVVMCGEFARVAEAGGWYLLYATRRRMHMHHALKRHARHAFGINALMILQRTLDVQSYADFMDLIHEFPDAVIEFQAFEGVKLGHLRRNTVIWEVRDY